MKKLIIFDAPIDCSKYKNKQIFNIIYNNWKNYIKIIEQMPFYKKRIPKGV